MTEDIEKMKFSEDYYNQNHILSKSGDLILEAKRVILNEQLDKIVNITLERVNGSRKTLENVAKECKNNIFWNQESWQEIPYPEINRIVRNSTIPRNTPDTEQTCDLIISDLLKINTRTENNEESRISKDKIIKKYFTAWKNIAKLKKQGRQMAKTNVEQREMLEKFIRQLRKRKKDDKLKLLREDKLKCLEEPEYVKPRSNYKNRFNAQKSIIDMQKAKLEEQNRIIDELKLGIIREDLQKSMENTKTSIREFFSECSTKVKCKIPLALIEEQKFTISSREAPKILRKMERRALERALNRQKILERKHLIEEARQRMLEETIEKKRAVEEEERKISLQLIKDRRKKELELQKIQQENKQKFLVKFNKAVNFHDKLLLKQCFKKLHIHWYKNVENLVLARKHSERKTVLMYFNLWLGVVESQYAIKYEIADSYMEYKMLKRTLDIWREVHLEQVRNMQVAEDFYDFRLASNTFITWHVYVCSQIMNYNKKTVIAERHYYRRILFHYFYQWRSLKTVNQLEKAKELKKSKWRQKVWEILPDYHPPGDIYT